jgi:2-phospho-L-lactate/phosphoenolpyruvate guanylyltransferase
MLVRDILSWRFCGESMKLAIVPCKPLARAKERLADVLTGPERRELTLAMLTDVVRAARVLDEVWVLCSDEDAARLAQKEGATAHADPVPDAGLNASLAAATADAVNAGADGVLVISSDCPAVTTADVKRLSVGTGVLIAPDRYGVGTNAIWRAPADTMPTYFGERSRRAHESYARGRDISCAIVPVSRVALDVDRPADLDDVFGMLAADSATRAVMASLGYPARGRR